jgi:D-beta-D-heptose 7-phosphate kinase/D-beta-D-heptose 1-phosphate adenosyltransferase
VFDILHAGHVQLLRRARALGDVLVVGLNSDASTRRLKGPTRPVNRESDRIALVSALDVVDYAVLFDEDTPAELIRTIRPHVHVKGGDYLAESLPEIGAVHEVGAEVEILSIVAGRSTTALIDRIVATASAGSDGAGLPQ